MNSLIGSRLLFLWIFVAVLLQVSCRGQPLDEPSNGVLAQGFEKAFSFIKKGEMENALDVLVDLKDKRPDIQEIYSQAGVLYENLGDPESAKKMYREGLKASKRLRKPVISGSIHFMYCNLLLQEKYKRKKAHPMDYARDKVMQHIEGISRWGIKSPLDNIDSMIEDFIDRHPDNEIAKEVCQVPTQEYPEEYLGYSNFGKMYIIDDDYSNALEQFETAKALLLKSDTPKDDKAAALKDVTGILGDLYRSQYRLNMYRAEDADKAIAYQKKAIQNQHTAGTISGLATIILYSKPFSLEPFKYMDEATLLRVDEVNQLLEQQGKETREYAHSWDDIGQVTPLDVHIDGQQQLPQAGESYQMKDLQDDYIVLSFGDKIPTRYIEPEIFKVEVDDVSIESPCGILFTSSKVLFGNHSSSITSYNGGTLPDQQVVHIHETVATLDFANSQNWYHWIIEKLPQLLLTLKYLPDLPVMLPSTRFSKEIVQILELPKEKVLYYDIEAEGRTSNGLKRYHFDKMFRIDWQQVPGVQLEPQHDYWRRYGSTAKGIQLVRHEILSRITKKNTLRPKVIYVSRKDAHYIRVVQNEELLLNALKSRLGDCFYVFTANKNKTLVDESEGTAQSLMDQAELFSSAEIVMGPHGAGLSNILFAQEGASLIYFPIKPMVDNSFANLVAALKTRMYPVSSLSAYYFGPFHLDQEKVDEVMQVVENVIRDRQWDVDQSCHANSGTSSTSATSTHDDL